MKPSHSHPLLVLFLAVCLMFSIAGCAAPVAGSQTQGASQSTAIQSSPNQTKNEDLLDSWREANANAVITLRDGAIEIRGAGAQANGSTLTITTGGMYVLSGSLRDGQVIVAAPADDDVRLVLNGVEITSGTSAAIYAAQADKLIITLAEGTQNTLTDAGAQYTYTDAAKEEPDAALFSKCDLSLNGTGQLTVTAGFKNGIGTKDDLVIANGTYRITAENDAIRGRDSVTVLDGSLTLTSKGDGIQSNNDEDAEKGWIRLSGGVYDITAALDGVQAETTLTISGGDFSLTTGGGVAPSPGDMAATNETASMKALKSGGDLLITGGTFAIDSADDAIHTGQNAAIAGGTFAIKTGDDGAHADGNLTVSGEAAMVIETCYEGLEGRSVTITGGDIRVTALNDGINAAGGSDDTDQGAFGADRFAGGGGSHLIDISGGVVRIVSEHDGLDSNGSIVISGGEVTISGPLTGGGEGAIDCDETFTQNGGILAAAGTAAFAAMKGSAGAINASGSQPVLQFQFTNAMEAGTDIALRDASGTTLISYTAQKQFQTIALSAPGMQDGERYTVFANGAEVYAVTLSGTLTSISETGGAVGSGMGGGGQRSLR